jgi:uncharacterized membrane protein YhaH (DUF805 family)
VTSPQPASVPLDAPYYGATIGIAFRRFWTKYATFSGRASRSEYWWWYLISIIVAIVFNILSLTTGGYGYQMDGSYATPSAGATVVYVIWGIWALATIIPGLALLVRRLHDTNRSGFWVFIGLVPFVGGIILLVFTILSSEPAGARFDAR